MNKERGTQKVQTAQCSCGGLSVTVRGNPVGVNACSCLQCQKRSGSAFAYTAFFRDAAVVGIAGHYRVWREMRDAGRWHDSHFCPVCGVALFCRLEAMPATLGVAVGCFGDPEFAAPDTFYWTSRRAHWLPLPDGMPRLDRQ